MKATSKKPKKTKESDILRYDTPMGTIEAKHGVDLDVPADKPLGKFLEEEGYPSLAGMIKD